MVIGKVFAGRYKVVKKIGSGGMQDVYLAHDGMTEYAVALKTPQPGQAGTHFRKSALVAARVNHHGVAKTLDYFEEGGQHFLIEEYVSGGTLEQATLDRIHYVDPHQAAHLLLQLAKGIAASHKAGVIHRDLKPSNILVAVDAGMLVVKITDFGIATLAEHVFDEAAKEGDLTRSTSGTVKGALPYMAPEMMFRKAGEHPGEAADVWSLGAMMFRLMTGKYPFGQGFQVPVNVSSGKREPWPDFMFRNEQFAPLARSVTELVDKMLSFKPADRPTATEVVTAAENLSFFIAERRQGKISEILFNGAHGKIDTNKGRVFYHSKSLYGDAKLKVGNGLEFCVHPGIPYPRAHPLVLMK
ncbi:serine/threonine-protein kinase [Taklimakanibacter deserti]|uniref:serine/threonine-protein kinase n=1 Tax=Taklimakanibacter deserti TaxID=2267839 RepID=UPI000E647288